MNDTIASSWSALRGARGFGGAALLLLLASACPAPGDGDGGIACAEDDGSITLPDGFCATVFADGLGRARHLAVSS